MDKKTEKYIGLSFYQISIADDDSEDAFNTVAEAFTTPPTEFEKTVRSDESSVSLLRGKLHKDANGLVYGTLIHTQKNDIPFTFDDETQTEEELTELGDKKGLGYETSFVFDPIVNIVMIENIKNGVGIGSFCHFFSSNFNLNTLEYGVVINPSDIDKLNRMTTITKFEVKIARLQSGNPFAGKKNVTANDIIAAADDTNTDTLDFSLSVGYKRGESLSLRKIKDFVRDFRKLRSTDNKELKKLLVSGRVGDDNPIEPLDLIQQRLKDSITVTRVRLNNLTTLNTRYEQLTTVYSSHKRELHRAYKPE